MFFFKKMLLLLFKKNTCICLFCQFSQKPFGEFRTNFQNTFSISYYSKMISQKIESINFLNVTFTNKHGFSFSVKFLRNY